LYGLRTRGGRNERVRRPVARRLALSLALLFLSGTGAVVARPEPAVNAPGLPKTEIGNPDLAARLAVQHLSTADGKFGHHEYNQEDWPYIQFFSFYRTPEKLLPIHRKLLNVWIHQLSFEQQISLPREVPGSHGRLVWVDIRNYGWNRPAVQAVAEREPYFQEPWVNHEHAEFLRRAAYVRNSKKALRKQVFHAQAVVRGDWFMRETGESDRSPSYYDLLFAGFRFPKGQRVETRVKRVQVPEYFKEDEHWPGGVDPRDGKYYKPGNYKVEKVRYKWVDRYLDKENDVFVDFPKNVDQWDQAFGIDKIRDYAREVRRDSDFGGIVEGSADKPKEGSIVAGHNRLIVVREGPNGAAMRTFDVFETSGDRDYTEKLIFKNGRFVKGNGADAVFDAGELIYYLPNGGIAGFLIDGKGNRAEIAATKAANATHDKRNNPGVRNIMDCQMCHAPAGGFIMPPNFLREWKDIGGVLGFKSPEKRNRVDGFFDRWQGRVKGYRERYENLIAECTKDPAKPDDKGWTGSKFAEELQAFRDQYDDPLSKEDVLAEVGVPEKEYREMARLTGDYRPISVLKGKTIPRTTFEKDVFPKLQLIREMLVEERRREGEVDRKRR
jgi:hypothetical protein